MLGNQTADEYRKAIEKGKELLDKRRVDFLETQPERYQREFRCVPLNYIKRWLDCFDGVATPREQIKMNCLRCVNYQQKEVELCPSRACSLWVHRPYQK